MLKRKNRLIGTLYKAGGTMDYQELSFGRDDSTVDILCLDTPIDKGLAGYAKSSLFPANVGLVVDITPSEILDYDYACLAHYRSNDSYMVHMEESIFTRLAMEVY